VAVRGHGPGRRDPGSADHETRIEGFDIASFDERANLARLWSVCFGRRTVQDGAAAVAPITSISASAPGSLAEEIDAMGVPGQDLVLDPLEPTVLGEIQFGNWALAHRDIMKLLAAAARPTSTSSSTSPLTVGSRR
jgi:hypothetical protein